MLDSNDRIEVQLPERRTDEPVRGIGSSRALRVLEVAATLTSGVRESCFSSWLSTGEIDDRAGQGSSDPFDHLHLLDDHLPHPVYRLGFHLDDDVIRSRDVMRGDHPV